VTVPIYFAGSARELCSYGLNLVSAERTRFEDHVSELSSVKKTWSPPFDHNSHLRTTHSARADHPGTANVG
jgi:hypothetical protein